MSILRYVSYNSDYKYKPGWIPAVIGAAAAVGSTIASGAINSSAASNLNRTNRMWQSRERQLSQYYQTAEREASQDWNAEQADKANAWTERMYNQYSSPQALARQYAEAGLNPRLAATNGESLGGVTATPGSSSGGAPGAPSPATFNAPPVDFSGAFTDVANAFKSIADAKKAGMDTKFLEATFNEQVKALKLDNDTKAFLLKLNVQTMPEKAQLEILKLTQEISTGEMEYNEARERLNGIIKDNKLKDLQADHYLEEFYSKLDYQDSMTDYNNAKAAGQKIENKYLPRRIVAEINKTIADTDQANQMARHIGLQADQLKEFNEMYKEEMQLKVANLKADQRSKFIEYCNKLIRTHNLATQGSEELSGIFGSSISASKALLDSVFGFAVDLDFSSMNYEEFEKKMLDKMSSIDVKDFARHYKLLK